MSLKKFNLRVYGLILNDLGEILISDEHEYGFPFTKFPGGGLEFGESLPNALKREIREELGLDVEIGDLFYFNEHAQISQFNENHQLFAFYYLVHINDQNERFREVYEVPLSEQGEKQRWLSLSGINYEELTFPIDRIVLHKLKKEKGIF